MATKFKIGDKVVAEELWKGKTLDTPLKGMVISLRKWNGVFEYQVKFERDGNKPEWRGWFSENDLITA